MKRVTVHKNDRKKKLGFKSWKIGLLAESIASTFLKAKLYTIREKRYKTPVGEIDLIIQKGNTLVFVEVKLRKTHTNAIESIHFYQKKRIVQAANFYLAATPSTKSLMLRFDVVTLNHFFTIKHLCNAWDETSN